MQHLVQYGQVHVAYVAWFPFWEIHHPGTQTEPWFSILKSQATYKTPKRTSLGFFSEGGPKTAESTTLPWRGLSRPWEETSTKPAFPTGRNPAPPKKPWLKPLFVGIYRGIEADTRERWCEMGFATTVPNPRLLPPGQLRTGL